MISFSDCCSFILSNLPSEQLSFLPAFGLGTSISLLILSYMYRKHLKTSWWNAVKEIFMDIFVTRPIVENHPEFIFCKNDNCARCKMSESLKKLIIDRWKNMKIPEDNLKYQRVWNAILQLLHSSRETEVSSNKSNQKPTIIRMELPSCPIWTYHKIFMGERELIKLNFKIILEEFSTILNLFQNGKTRGWKVNVIPSGHWCIFPLIDQGSPNEDNLRLCPNTSVLLNSLPSLMKDCVFGNACFSLLYPNSQIEPHYGPTNLRLRYHLGLIVPQGCCLEVDGTHLRWIEGEDLIFDDSFQHSASFSNQNYANPRAILILDFWHPDVSASEKKALLKLLNPSFT